MWVPEENIGEIILRATLVYVVLLLGMRIIGKRDVGQMTPFDMVLLLLIANAVQNSMTGDDYSLTGGLIAGVTLLVFNFIIARLAWRFKKFRFFIDGQPTLLVHWGKVNNRNMAKERVSRDELMQAMRENDVCELSDVGMAMLEIDGSISIVRKEDMKKSKPRGKKAG